MDSAASLLAVVFLDLGIASPEVHDTHGIRILLELLGRLEHVRVLLREIAEVFPHIGSLFMVNRLATVDFTEALASASISPP